MIIDCHECEAKVKANVIGEKDYFFEYDDEPWRAALLECPSCKRPLFGIGELSQVGEGQWEIDHLVRKWPKPANAIHHSIPALVRSSLSEARSCFQAKAYSACAVMSGRAVEGICVELLGSKVVLAKGLRELRDKQLIDSRLFEWGEALRNKRNLGAHATTESVSRDDAEDVLDFAIAIAEYVFVLAKKFERFQKRQVKVVAAP